MAAGAAPPPTGSQGAPAAPKGAFRSPRSGEVDKSANIPVVPLLPSSPEEGLSPDLPVSNCCEISVVDSNLDLDQDGKREMRLRRSASVSSSDARFIDLKRSKVLTDDLSRSGSDLWPNLVKSMKTVHASNAMLGVILVLGTIAVSLSFAVPASQDLAVQSRETGKQSGAMCVDFATQSVDRLTHLALGAFHVGQANRLEAFLVDRFVVGPRAIEMLMQHAGSYALSWDFFESSPVRRSLISLMRSVGSFVSTGLFSMAKAEQSRFSSWRGKMLMRDGDRLLMVESNMGSERVGVVDHRGKIAEELNSSVCGRSSEGGCIEPLVLTSDTSVVVIGELLYCIRRTETNESVTVVFSAVLLSDLDAFFVQSFEDPVFNFYSVANVSLSVTDMSDHGDHHSMHTNLSDPDIVELTWGRQHFVVDPHHDGFHIGHGDLHSVGGMPLKNAWHLMSMMRVVEVYGRVEDSGHASQEVMMAEFGWAEEQRNESFQFMHVTLSLVAIILMTLSWVYARSLAGPLRVLKDEMHAMAHMDLESISRHEHTSLITEFEEMNRAFRRMVMHMAEYRKHLPHSLLQGDHLYDQEELPREPDDARTVFSTVTRSSIGLRSSPAGPKRGGRSEVVDCLNRLTSQQLRQRRASVVLIASPGQVSPEQFVQFSSEIVDCLRKHNGTWLSTSQHGITAVWNAFTNDGEIHAVLAADFTLSVTRRIHTHVAACYGMVRAGFASGSEAEQKKPFLHGPPLTGAMSLIGLAKTLQLFRVCDVRIARESDPVRSSTRPVDVIRLPSGASGCFSFPSLTACEIASIGELGTESDLQMWGTAFGLFVEGKWGTAARAFDEYLEHRSDDFQATRLHRLALHFEATVEEGQAYCRQQSQSVGWDFWETECLGASNAELIPTALTPMSLPRFTGPEHEEMLRQEIAKVTATSPHVESVSMSHSDIQALHNRLLPPVQNSAPKGNPYASPSTADSQIRDSKPTSVLSSQSLPDGAPMLPDSQSGVDASVRKTRGSEVKDADAVKKKGETVVDRGGVGYQQSQILLGKGACGAVWMGMSDEGQLVAMKQLVISKGKKGEEAKVQQQVDELVSEVTLLTQLRHENIVSYLTSVVHAKSVWIITEYLPGGSLRDVSFHFGPLGTRQLRRYTIGVLLGLQFLHGRGVVHRDVKPHNVLLQINGTCKLTDFGASVMVANLVGGDEEEKAPEGPVGTPAYMAPEACRGEAGPAADIWGVGVMFLQLAAADLPWPQELGKDPMEFMRRLECDPELMPTIPPLLFEECGSEAVVFAQSCLVRDPTGRASAEQLLASSFCRSK
eukprot:Hpha_TRINITY_DN2919_c0_g1::TRINITY_DN2919_c0_g1_i1::g.19671::m.19671/K17533/MAP3K19, YSK4; mitogen-activated protein kinase kinase kinase 19